MTDLQPTTEKTVEAALLAALRDPEVAEILLAEGLEVTGARTLEEGGFMTLSRGVAFTCADGSEWIVSIACRSYPY